MKTLTVIFLLCNYFVINDETIKVMVIVLDYCSHYFGYLTCISVVMVNN